MAGYSCGRSGRTSRAEAKPPKGATSTNTLVEISCGSTHGHTGRVVLPTLELPRRDNPMTHNAEIARAKTQFAFESSPRRACDKITFGRERSPDGNQGSRKPGQ